MKKQRLMSLALVAAMLSVTACGVKTKSEATGTTAAPAPAQTQAAAPAAQGGETQAAAPAAQSGPVNLKLLYNSSDEIVANVVRDELTKGGFTVDMAPAADGATFREQSANGNFDIAISSWANPVGTPDYGCRGIWHSKGDSNRTGINDPDLDKLVEEASAVTADHYVEAYGAAEQLAIEDKVYMTPLYIALSGRPYNVVLKPESVTANQRWETLDYVDESLRETRPVTLTQTGSSITTWDPIRADDQSSGYALDEMYIHLLTLKPDWGVTTDASLSYNYAIADGNEKYYFLLRDDCGFARIDKDGKVYDSGVKVAGEDVVYSLDRAMDKDSTPMHMTYSMFENLESTTIVEDIKELEDTKVADGRSVKEVLEEGVTPIAEVVASRNDVDNAAGKYQVICCKTKMPYPQILNCLTFHGAGIVDSEWVEEQNKDVAIANYDASKDKLYGDSVTTVEGATYDNQLSLSGSYVLTSMNDYQMNFVANPYLRTNDPEYHAISTLVNKFISDRDTALSAVRSGDVDFCYNIPATKYEIVNSDPNLGLVMFPGIRAYMLAFNMFGNSEVSGSVDLRKAISACINFEDIKAVQAGNAIDLNSQLGTCLDTGIRPNYQAGDAEKYLQAYFASK